jgi:energy-coupling factor transporter ATP-binding protein EcfA2
VTAGLALRGVRYRYAGAAGYALNGVDLVVAPGEVVGVVGANDSGKSTLCLVAAGLAPGTIGGQLEGTATIDGADLASLKPHEHAQRAGILFQNPATQLSGTSRSVWEEIAFGPRNLGLPVAEIVARVDATMAALNIAHLGQRDPQRLSGGQAQLVALASVIALGPPYLILDEPTSELDPRGTRLVGEALAAFARSAGAGVLLVEHKTDLIERLAARVIVLAGGRVELTGPTDRIVADPMLRALGVEPPARVRLGVELRAAGLTVPDDVWADEPAASGEPASTDEPATAGDSR